MKKNIVVLGGGPGGLAAAWKLARGGHAVTVLERDPVVGGLAGTFAYRDFLFDYGPHAFNIDVPEVIEEIKALLGPDFVEKVFKSQVVFRNKFVNYPLRGADVFTSINPLLGLWCVFDFAFARIRARLAPKEAVETFESWVVNRFGRTLYNIYFGPYTRKVWGRDPSELAGIFASQRIPVLHLWDLIQRTIFRKQGGEHRHNEYVDVAYYPRKGIGQISERLAEELVAHGGKILTESKVQGVRVEEGKVRSVLFSQGGQADERACDFLLTTIPIRDFIPLCDDQLPETVKSAARGMHYRAARLVYLLLDAEQASTTPYIYFSNPEVIFNRIYEIRCFSPDMSPAGKTALCVEVTCDEGDDIWNATDEALLPDVVGPLEHAGLIQKAHVYDYFSRAIQHAYPTYEVGFEKRMGAIMGWINQVPNLLTYGRQGLFTYTNSNHSIDMGFRSAAYADAWLAGKEPPQPKSEMFRDYSIWY